jgi:hypothetical protein
MKIFKISGTKVGKIDDSSGDGTTDETFGKGNSKHSFQRLQYYIKLTGSFQTLMIF